MKKKTIYGAACVLALLVVTGCSNMLLEKPRARTGGAEAPEGFGTVAVRLTQGAARTVLPAIDLSALYPKYLFSKDGAAAAEKTPEGGKFLLEPGTYRLTVEVYTEGTHENLAAQGTTDADLTINAGVDAGTVSLTLRPVATGDGTGDLEFSLSYPAGATVETFTLTLIAGGESPLDLAAAGTPSATDPVVLSGTKTAVPVGYYLLRAIVKDVGGASAGRTEVVHVYQNLKAAADYLFTAEDFRAYRVTTNADSGPGSLRQALTDAQTVSGGPPLLRVLLEPGAVIALESSLPTISNSIIIEGNGVTLTRAASWTTPNPMLVISNNSSDETVKISGIHFKDGRSGQNGSGAITNYEILTLESCIFSGNQITDTSYSSSAIYSGNTLTIRGCTFYGNTAPTGFGVVVYFAGNGKTLTLTGNLFYGNSATMPLVSNYQGTVTASYNAADTAFGTGQGGWAQGTGDLRIAAAPPVSGTTFKLLSGSGAAGALAALPLEYPAADFYGNPLNNGAAAGAVQAVAEGSGYYLEATVNNGPAGAVTVAAQPDRDGLYPPGSALTAAANPGYAWGYWLVNGVKTTDSPLVPSGHARIQAVFNRAVTVDTFTDGTGSGTLRYALTNAQDGDRITMSGVTAGTTTIALASALPEITKSITIAGNGVTLTRAASWTTPPTYGGLLYISNANAEVQIGRVHFKDGSAINGGAINNWGTLTLESCVFSGNQANGGGAIYGYNTLTIQGCTFYGNTASYSGALYFYENTGKTLTLAGNLFYGNTATRYPVAYAYGAVVNASYNVVDRPFGTNTAQCGWAQGTGDTVLTNLPVSPRTFRLLYSSEAAAKLPNTLPTEYPDTDFYGNPINGGGAAGAIQGSTTNQSGYYYLETSVNNSLGGTLAVSPAPDADGLYAAGSTITITPSPNSGSGYTLGYWLVNGAQTAAAPTSLSDHTWVQAVFNRAVTVTAFTDGAESAGTLRHALTNAQDGDRITLDKTTAGTDTIELGSALPQITKSIVIEGNGVTLTRAASWTTPPTYGGLLYISAANAEVQIGRVHFKDGGAINGGAIFNYGTLTLESCIFSDNRTTLGYGGAVYSENTLTIRGCTFYENSSVNYGGAVYFEAQGKTLTLTGNLFYGNTAQSYPVVRNNSFGPVDASYNVVDVALGTGSAQAGLAAGTGDTITTGDPIDPATFAPKTGSPGISDIGIVSSGLADFPEKDFYGETRTFPGAAGAVK